MLDDDTDFFEPIAQKREARADLPEGLELPARDRAGRPGRDGETEDKQITYALLEEAPRRDLASRRSSASASGSPRSSVPADREIGFELEYETSTRTR